MRFTALFAASGPSLPLSVRAACADCIAVEVFGREAATLGDDGFKGSGGGALSGSELSHLAVMVSNVWAYRKHGVPLHGDHGLAKID